MFKLKEELSTIFPTITIQCYEHWFDNRDIIDFDFELEQLKEFSKNKSSVIIAKLVGVLLTIKAIQDNIIHPKSCVFLGTPLIWAYENNFRIDVWSKKLKTPTLFIQNSKDPLCSSKNLKEYLEDQQIMNYQFQKLEGETHDYVDFEKMKKLIKDFLEMNEKEETKNTNT